MPEIKFNCLNCGVEIEVDGGIAGSLVQCPNCKYNLMLPVQGIRQGMKIAGYEIISRLGAGGMGEVWLAKQTAMDRKVALKILPSALTSDKDFVDRFLKEVKNAAKLEHQNIVTSFDAGVDGNIYYLAMSYVDGVLLDNRLGIDRKIPEKEALQIIRCVADALCYAWNEFKILHRDIKPANIMIDSRKIPKLMDMGISKSLSDEKGLTITGMIIGTPYYMSPEQARTDTDIDCRSDIYSLGATLYHLVAGEVPYDATTAMGILTKHITEPFPPPQNKNPEVSDECSVLLEAMMAKRPDDRPKTWEDVIMDIDLVLSGKFPSTKRPEIGKSLVLQETPSQKSGRQKTLQQFQKTEVLEKNGLTTGFQSCRKKNEHGKRLSTVLIAAGITLSVIIISLIALTLFIGKDKKSASEKAPAPALPESAKSGAVSPEIMEKVRQARTKTGKVIRVSPDGKTEGTLDPETAAKQLEPGTILRFGKEWKKGQNVKSEWGGVFPKVSCTDIIIESESPISITLPPKSILRNSKVFILSFSGEATIVDSKIFTTRGIQEKEEVIIHNCEILSGLSQLRKLNVSSSTFAGYILLFCCSGIIQNSVFYSPNTVVASYPGFKPTSDLEFENCVLFADGSIAVKSKNPGTPLSDERIFDVSQMKWMKARDCTFKKAEFMSISVDYENLTSDRRLQDGSPGKGAGFGGTDLGAFFNDNGMPVPPDTAKSVIPSRK